MLLKMKGRIYQSKISEISNAIRERDMMSEGE